MKKAVLKITIEELEKDADEYAVNAEKNGAVEEMKSLLVKSNSSHKTEGQKRKTKSLSAGHSLSNISYPLIRICVRTKWMAPMQIKGTVVKKNYCLNIFWITILS